ncbi:OmpH family outer membrane protein [Balneola vulgaris]|jgi:outer membrane protein|uniref:OmpH family outer membrane protein n=1 Tax=Balneola vulgaris TaxID=287535 RepID=UPI000370269F|nr:OmpH family outer membrane protein [Balneola vulgaris]
MLKKISLGIAFIFISLISVNTYAQDTKIGFINPQAVLNRMPEMKAIQQRLKNFADRKTQELAQQEAALQTALTNYEQKRGVISDEAKQAEEQKLQQMNMELAQAERTAQNEVQAKRNELLGPLLSQIGDAINAVAERKGLSYVLNTTTNTGDMIILYASQSYAAEYNITDAVMQELGI